MDEYFIQNIPWTISKPGIIQRSFILHAFTGGKAPNLTAFCAIFAQDNNAHFPIMLSFLAMFLLSVMSLWLFDSFFHPIFPQNQAIISFLNMVFFFFPFRTLENQKSLLRLRAKELSLYPNLTDLWVWTNFVTSFDEHSSQDTSSVTEIKSSKIYIPLFLIGSSANRLYLISFLPCIQSTMQHRFCLPPQ